MKWYYIFLSTAIGAVTAFPKNFPKHAMETVQLIANDFIPYKYTDANNLFQYNKECSSNKP